MLGKLFIFLQYILPHHALSRFAGYLASSESVWLKNALIDILIANYPIRMDEAQNSDPHSYKSFNDFFTRAFKEGARSVDTSSDAIVSPVDAKISQMGSIDQGRMIQAKGQWFSAQELLGGDIDRSKPFINGSFTTLYLAPKDYHRIHMPLSGKLKEMIYVPGKLFSVNPLTAENVPRLFARNERVVSIFETEIGEVAVVSVGAMIVASIETVWAGQVAPAQNKISAINYKKKPKSVNLKKGDEMGRFKLGSTVILLFSENAIQWDQKLKIEQDIKMGERIAVTK